MAATQHQNTAVGQVSASERREARGPAYRGRDETRRFIGTSEFWLTLIGVAAVAVIYNLAADASLDLWRATLLGSAMGIAYIVSRGIAKAGTPRDQWDKDSRSEHSY